MTDGQRVLYRETATFCQELTEEIRSAERNGTPTSLQIFASGRCALILSLIGDIVRLAQKSDKEDAR